MEQKKSLCGTAKRSLQSKLRDSSAGFTLVELIVVIAILGMRAA